MNRAMGGGSRELEARAGRALLAPPADELPTAPALAVPDARPQTDLGSVVARIADGVGELSDNLAALIRLFGQTPVPATFRTTFATGSQSGVGEIQVRGTAQRSFLAYSYVAALVDDIAGTGILALSLFSGQREVTNGAMGPEAIQCDVANRRCLERPLIVFADGIIRSTVTANAGRTVAAGSRFTVRGFLVPNDVAERIRKLIGQFRAYAATATVAVPSGVANVVTADLTVARVFRESGASPPGTIARLYLGAGVGAVAPVADIPPAEWPTYDEGGLRAPRVSIPVGDRINVEATGLAGADELTFYVVGGEVA